MKRALIMMFAAVICVGSFILPAAANSTDSLHLTSEEKTLLEVSSDDVVVKIFAGFFMESFSRQEDILSILEKSKTWYLVERNNDDEMALSMYRRKDNGELGRFSYATSGWSNFYTYAVSPNKVFDSSVKVNSVYCLDIEPSPEDVCIYYDTDQGDYVLYRQNLFGDETYLFPISVFYEVQEVLYNDLRAIPELNVGTNPPLKELYDADRYLFRDGHLFNPKSNAFHWVVMGLIIVPLAAGGVLWFLFHRRKAKGTNG